jgi:hypothetical protein
MFSLMAWVLRIEFPLLWEIHSPVVFRAIAIVAFEERIEKSE